MRAVPAFAHRQPFFLSTQAVTGEPTPPRRRLRTRWPPSAGFRFATGSRGNSWVGVRRSRFASANAKDRHRLAGGLKSDVSATLSVGRSDYRCGRPVAQRKSHVSNRMQELRPNALTSTRCTSRTQIPTPSRDRRSRTRSCSLSSMQTLRSCSREYHHHFRCRS